jgi:broad specificity phosphatase PhoE
MHIYVIRHGLSEGNCNGLIQGLTDSPLTLTGEKQADLLGRYFASKNISPSVVYTSPLQRAFRTAEILSAQLNPRPELIAVDQLTEIDTGELSGVSLEAAYEKYPKDFAPDINRWLDFGAFGGESFDIFFSRVGDAVADLTKDWDLLEDRTIFFVTHAGAMRPLLKTILKAEGDFMFFAFGNCSHVRIAFRKIRNSVRRVIECSIPIDGVAQMMGEPAPSIEDDVIDKA